MDLGSDELFAFLQDSQAPALQTPPRPATQTALEALEASARKGDDGAKSPGATASTRSPSGSSPSGSMPSASSTPTPETKNGDPRPSFPTALSSLRSFSSASMDSVKSVSPADLQHLMEDIRKAKNEVDKEVKKESKKNKNADGSNEAVKAVKDTQIRKYTLQFQFV